MVRHHEGRTPCTPNEASHRAILTAFEACDLATAVGYYADDAVFHINGRGPLACDHEGF